MKTLLISGFIPRKSERLASPRTLGKESGLYSFGQTRRSEIPTAEDPLYKQAVILHRIRERRKLSSHGCYHQARQDKRETKLPQKKKKWWKLWT